jgi:hypothetical protein
MGETQWKKFTSTCAGAVKSLLPGGKWLILIFDLLGDATGGPLTPAHSNALTEVFEECRSDFSRSNSLSSAGSLESAASLPGSTRKRPAVRV